jgi:hypothetical protein
VKKARLEVDRYEAENKTVSLCGGRPRVGADLAWLEHVHVCTSASQLEQRMKSMEAARQKDREEAQAKIMEAMEHAKRDADRESERRVSELQAQLNNQMLEMKVGPRLCLAHGFTFTRLANEVRAVLIRPLRTRTRRTSRSSSPSR